MIPTEIFLQQPVESELICQICAAVLENPTTACPNGHTFCGSCLQTWEQQQNKCPGGCGSSITKSTNRPLRNIILKMHVKCPAKEKRDDRPEKRARHGHDHYRASSASASDQQPTVSACNWEGTLSEYLEKHADHECGFAIKICKCKEEVRVSHWQKHLADECKLRAVKCPQCNRGMKQKRLMKHILHECPETKVKCPGCDGRMSRQQLGTINSSKCKYDDDKYTGHLKVCPKLTVPCEFLGCDVQMPREQLDEHHMTCARMHARLVSKHIEKLREDSLWTSMEIDWMIPRNLCLLMDSEERFVPESERVTVGEYCVFLKLEVDEDEDVVLGVCAEGADNRIVPEIDSLLVVSDDGKVLLKDSDWNVLNSDGEDDPYSYVANLTTGLGQDEQFVTLEHLLGEAAEGIELNVSFRLRRPQKVALGCENGPE